MEDRRRFPRFPIYCPLQYRCEDTNPRDTSITINISEGGALISTRRFVEIASNLILRFILKNKEFFIRAKVIHIQYEKGEGLYSIGVEFVDRPPDFVSILYGELETVMLYQKRYSEETGRAISLAEASMKWYRNAPIPL